MTATHHCELCERKTTHVFGEIDLDELMLRIDDPELIEAAKAVREELPSQMFPTLRCVVCGNHVPVEIK